jgi:putative CocE/NonD family hydrolase
MKQILPALLLTAFVNQNAYVQYKALDESITFQPSAAGTSYEGIKHSDTATDGNHAEGENYEIIVKENVMVPMRDGIKLATDIYFPGTNGIVAEGEFPVILSRTPYGKHRNKPGKYVKYGYIGINQDCRGRYNSEGIWHNQIDDRRDGYDAIEWIARQPWCNGKIGMTGTSYVGATQHLAAMEKPPHLTTIVPINPAINYGSGGARRGGAFLLLHYHWHLRHASEGSKPAQDTLIRAELENQYKNVRQYLLNLPLRKGMTPLRLAPGYEDYLINFLEHGKNDEFWRFNNTIDYADEHKDIPVFLISGWYDFLNISTTETFSALKRIKQSPAYLLVGPWTHGPFRSYHGQVDFGQNAAMSEEKNRMFRIWFDHWLKGMDNDFKDQVPFHSNVRLFVMGTGDGHKTREGKLFHGGEWREFSDYPPPQAQNKKFYIHEDGTLSLHPPEVRNSSTTYEFDPNNPVPTVGGAVCCAQKIMKGGAYNQWSDEHNWIWPFPVPLSARYDVVVFQSKPLEEDTEIIGPVRAKIWASSSALDTDFTVKLIDVYPPGKDFPAGFELIMGDGIIRARFRDSDKEEKLMTPGQIYEFDIELDPCGNVFKKGHRIRIDISSSNFPRFDVNPNTGEPLNNNRRQETAVNTVYHDREHPSHVILPVMPRRNF